MWKVLSTEKEDSGGPSYIGTLLKKKRSVKEILAEIVRDTARISSYFSDFVYVVSRTISYSVSESSLHFISCLTVYAGGAKCYLYSAASIFTTTRKRMTWGLLNRVERFITFGHFAAERVF